MCKVLNVSSSGYYYWCKHPLGARQLKQSKLVDHIRQVHTQSRGRYGPLGLPVSCGSGA